MVELLTRRKEDRCAFVVLEKPGRAPFLCGGARWAHEDARACEAGTHAFVHPDVAAAAVAAWRRA
jgi:hypothetical protein